MSRYRFTKINKSKTSQDKPKSYSKYDTTIYQSVPERNDDIFKNIFLCSFFFGLSIFVRPNLLPASLLFIAGFLAELILKFNLNKDKYSIKNKTF